MDEPAQIKTVEQSVSVTPQAIADGLSARGFGLDRQLDLVVEFLSDPDEKTRSKADLIMKLWKMQGMDDDPKSELERKMRKLQTTLEQAEKSQAEEHAGGYPQ